jgi:hypothetical protein
MYHELDDFTMCPSCNTYIFYILNIVFKASVKRRLGGKAHQGVEASGRLSSLSKASRRRCLLTSARCEQRRRRWEQGKAPGDALLS